MSRWSASAFEQSLEYTGRVERVDCIQRISDSRFAVSGHENSIGIYSLDQGTPLSSLHGHEGRVPRWRCIHQGRFLASASYDMSWRLWDLETEREIQKQAPRQARLWDCFSSRWRPLGAHPVWTHWPVFGTAGLGGAFGRLSGAGMRMPSSL